MPVASSRIDLYLDNAERFVKSHGVIFVFIDRMEPALKPCSTAKLAEAGLHVSLTPNNGCTKQLVLTVGLPFQNVQLHSRQPLK